MGMQEGKLNPYGRLALALKGSGAFSEPSLFVWPFRHIAQRRVFDAFS
jgi:hypothetical protein